eukprot:8482088-Pyramimonas_sp.AAC.1
MKGQVGQGLDRACPADLDRLPREAMVELSAVYNTIEQCGTWPWQLLAVLGRLLLNKPTGDRVIGLVCVLCRGWSAAREPYTKEWNTQSQTDWGAARAGNSALKEAYMRAMDEELFFRLRSSQGHALLDIKSFYDEIGWSILVDRALECNFPATTLRLELQVCAGPRLLAQADT